MSFITSTCTPQPTTFTFFNTEVTLSFAPLAIQNRKPKIKTQCVVNEKRKTKFCLRNRRLKMKNFFAIVIKIN